MKSMLMGFALSLKAWFAARTNPGVFFLKVKLSLCYCVHSKLAAKRIIFFTSYTVTAVPYCVACVTVPITGKLILLKDSYTLCHTMVNGEFHSS